MRQYIRLALVAPLRSPLLSALPSTARLPMGKHCVVPFLGGMVHARASSGSAPATSTPSTLPAVDAEVRAQREELRKAVLRKAEAEARKADIEAGKAEAEARKADIEVGKAEATADIELGAAKARAEAEARKADIEAGKAEAEARKADIEAGKAEASADIELGVAKARAEMDAAKAKIELEEATVKAGASKAKAEADAAKAKADAATAKAKAEADLDSSVHKIKVDAWASLRSFLPWVTGVALLGALAVDYYVHESKVYIRRSMLSKLRECKPPVQLPTPPSTVLTVAQEPLTLGFLPTLLLGPSGSGKSTLLGSIALTLPKPAPVVLVRMRQPAKLGAVASPAKEGNMEGKALMDATAFQVFSQIGFPVRRSFIAGILSQGFTLTGDFTKIELSSETSNRLVTALVMLFDVCGELKEERQKTMDPLDAAPILLFDEVQDLIKDERLRKAGGQVVLDMLGALLVGYCVDRRAVRAVVAGSSAELYFAFAASGPLRSARWSCFDLKDPDEDAMVAALVKCGYEASDARSMTRLCGTRLRLMEGPLCKGAKTLSTAEFLRGSSLAGQVDISDVFSTLTPADAKQLAKLLDTIEACDTGPSEARRPTKEGLPAALKHADIAPLLFVDRRRKLFFQSQLIRRMWEEVRSAYV